MNNDLINRSELKEAINTWDKFACLPNGELEPFRNLEHPEMFEPYIHLRDVIKAIDGMPTVPLPDFKEGYKQAILDGKTNFSRQKGEWINHRNDFGHNIADCSECGKTMQWHDEDEDGIPRYCWFCGAEMKGPYKKSGTENEDLEARARWVCCPMCDRETCNRRADDCDVKIWLEKHKEV